MQDTPTMKQKCKYLASKEAEGNWDWLLKNKIYQINKSKLSYQNWFWYQKILGEIWTEWVLTLEPSPLCLWVNLSSPPDEYSEYFRYFWHLEYFRYSLDIWDIWDILNIGIFKIFQYFALLPRKIFGRRKENYLFLLMGHIM